jgi:hypothetical protein
MALRFCADQQLYTDYSHYERAFHWNVSGAIDSTLLFHAYWSGRLGPLHHLCLRSLLLTQSPPHEIWLWMPRSDLARNAAFIQSYRSIAHVHFRAYDVRVEARDTVFANRTDLLEDTQLLPSRGRPVTPTGPEAISDGVRLLVLGRYGGIYFDMDTLFLHDLRPLTSAEFIYQWSDQPCGTNAISHFRQDSVALRSLAERAISSGTCHPATLLRFDALTALPGDTCVLPSFVFDPLWIAHDTGAAIGCFRSLNDFFTLDVEMPLSAFFPHSYAYDWHNRWHVPIRPDTLIGRFSAEIGSQFAARFGA